MKRTHRRPGSQTVRTIFVVLAGIALLGTACNWRLHTRTPPKQDRETAPAFSLPDHAGSTYTLDAVKADGAAVVVFYRGYW